MKRHDTQGCTEILDRIHLYVGDDLDPEALKTVRAHLDDCESCARCAGDASRARQVFATSFREREAVLPRADLWSGIRDVLVEEGRIVGSLSRNAAPRETTERRQRTRPRGRLRLVRHAASLAAAAALLVMTGQYVYRGPTVLDVVDTSGISGPNRGGSGSVVTAQPDVSASGLASASFASSGQLRKVEPGRPGLVDSAGMIVDQVHPMEQPGAPGVLSGTQLVRYK